VIDICTLLGRYAS